MNNIVALYSENLFIDTGIFAFQADRHGWSTSFYRFVVTGE